MAGCLEERVSIRVHSGIGLEEYWRARTCARIVVSIRDHSGIGLEAVSVQPWSNQPGFNPRSQRHRVGRLPKESLEIARRFLFQSAFTAA